MVKLTEVANSSSIAAHGYEPASQVLAIRFKHTKSRTYHYHEVSPEAAKAFQSAESLGKHHAKHIAGQFHCTSVDA